MAAGWQLRRGAVLRQIGRAGGGRPCARECIGSSTIMPSDNETPDRSSDRTSKHSSLSLNMASDNIRDLCKEKLDVVDAIMDALAEELRVKKANQNLALPFKKYLIEATMVQSRLEGQVHELLRENARLRQQVELYVQADSNHARLEGQIDILRDEKERLNAELEETKLEVCKLRVEKTRLENQLEQIKGSKHMGEEEKAKLQAEIEGLKRINSTIVEKNVAMTYASAASAPASVKTPKAIETKMQKVKESNLLFLKPTNNQATKEVEQALIKAINPKEYKVKIRGIRKTPNTVIVETATKEDIEKVKKKAEQLKDIRCEESKKKRPMLAVYQVPTSIPDAEFMEQLYAINLSEDMNESDFKKEVAIRFKTGRRDRRTANNILEVSPRVWSILLQKDRV